MTKNDPTRSNPRAAFVADVYEGRLAAARAAYPNDEGNYQRRVKVPPVAVPRTEGYEDLPEAVYAARRATRRPGLAAGAGAMAALALLSMGSGCASTADAMRNLGNDHAAVRMKIPTPWGVQEISRVNPGPGESAEITPDGTIRASGVRK